MRRIIIWALIGLLFLSCGTCLARPVDDGPKATSVDAVRGGSFVGPGDSNQSSTPRPGIPATIAIITTIVIGAVLVLILIGYSGAPTIPPTNETTARLYGFTVFWLTLCVLALLNAWLIIDLMRHSGMSIARAVVTMLLLLPALFLFGECGLTHRRLLASLRREALPEGDESAATILALIQQLRQAMGLRREIRVLISRQVNQSPYIFSALWGPAWLILPANFDAMLRLACDNQTRLSSALKRLVCAHELAHVKGGDVQALPLVRAFSKAVPACALGLGGVLIGLCWAPDQDLHLFVKPLCSVFIMATVFGFFLIRKFMQAREHMADGAATLFVAPADCRALANASAAEASPLERLLFETAAWSRGGRRWTWLQHSFHALMWSERGLLAGLVQHAQARGNQIVSKTYTMPARLIGWTWGVLLSGLTAACLHILLRTVKLTFFHLHLLTQYGQPFASYLRGMETWSRWTEASYGAMAFSLFAPALVGISSAVVLLLPLRDAFADVVHLKTRQGLVILVGILLTAIVFLLATDMMPSVGRPDLPWFPALKLSSMFSAMIIFLAGAFLLACMNLKWSVLTSDLQRLLAMLLPELLTAFIPWVIILLFFRGLPLTAKLWLMVFQALLMGTLLNSVLLHRLTREAYVRSEWLEYDRLLWRKRLYVRAPYELIATGRTVRLHLLKGLISFALLGLLAATIWYPWLCHQDAWYLANQKEVAAKVAVWSQTHPTGWPAFRDYFWPYMMHSAAQAHLPVSAAILLLASCLLVPCLFITLSIGTVVNTNSQAGILERVPLLDRISKLTCDALVGNSLKRKYLQAVLNGVSDLRPYMQGFENIPCFTATCAALDMAHAELPATTRRGMEGWVQRCALPSGGFGFAPGASADLLHTHAAILYFRRRGLLDENHALTHVAWLQAQLPQDQAPAAARRAAGLLLNARLALEALSSISPAQPKTETTRLPQYLIMIWRGSERTIEDTFNFLMAISALKGVAATQLFDDIYTDWLPRHEELLGHLDPRSRLASIAQLLQILALLYPEDFRARGSVRQAIDTLTKAYA